VIYLYLSQVIAVRNQTMHSPNLLLDDEYALDSLNKMVALLESVQSAMNGKCDITDCQVATEDIKKVGCCCCCCCFLVNLITGIYKCLLFYYGKVSLFYLGL